MQIDLEEKEEKHAMQIHELLYAFRKESKDSGIPYDFFLGALIQEIIMGFVSLDMNNREFIGAMEDAWYKYAPIVAKRFKELEEEEENLTRLQNDTD